MESTVFIVLCADPDYDYVACCATLSDAVEMCRREMVTEEILRVASDPHRGWTVSRYSDAEAEYTIHVATPWRAD